MRKNWRALLLILLIAGCATEAREADRAAVYESLLGDHCCLDRAILQEVTDTMGLAGSARRWSNHEEMRRFSPGSAGGRRRLVPREPDGAPVAGHPSCDGAGSAAPSRQRTEDPATDTAGRHHPVAGPGDDRVDIWSGIQR